MLNQRDRQSVASRRGIATLWVLLLVPAIGLLLIVVTDLATLWLAKQELKSAVEAAALSGAKTWGEGGSAAQARLDANKLFAVNTYAGQASTLNAANNGAGINGNGSSTEIILGSIQRSSNGNLTFRCNCEPCPVISLRVAVDAADTWLDPDGFRVESFTQSNGNAARLRSVSWTIPVEADAIQGYFSNRAAFGPNTTSVPAGVTYTYTNPVPAPPNGPGFRTVTATFPGSGAAPNTGGNVLTFGLDVDYIGTSGGGPSDGDFFGGVTITAVIEACGTPASSYTLPAATMTDDGIDNNRTAVTFGGTVPGYDPGVWIRKTAAVPSLNSSYLGFNFGPYNLSAQAVARYRCTSGPPELVVIETFNCP